MEHTCGSFQRVLSLSEDANQARVMRLNLPKAEKAVLRKITLNAA